MIGFFGNSTHYAKVLRKIHWQHNELESVCIFSPIPDGRGGYQQRVPKFLGKTVHNFLRQDCDVMSLIDFTAEGMIINSDILYHKHT